MFEDSLFDSGAGKPSRKAWPKLCGYADQCELHARWRIEGGSVRSIKKPGTEVPG